MGVVVIKTIITTWCLIGLVTILVSFARSIKNYGWDRFSSDFDRLDLLYGICAVIAGPISIKWAKIAIKEAEEVI